MKRVVFLGGLLLVVVVLSVGCASRMTPVTGSRPTGYRLERMEAWRLQREETLRRVREAQEELEQEVEELEDEQETQVELDSEEQETRDTDVEEAEEPKEIEEASDSEQPGESEPPTPIRTRPEDKPRIDVAPPEIKPLPPCKDNDPKNLPFDKEEYKDTVWEDQNNWYVWGVGTSQDWQFAFDHAKQDALVRLARALGPRQSTTLSKKTESGKLEVYKERVETSIQGLRELRKERLRSGKQGVLRWAILMTAPKALNPKATN